ncbi:bifunctional glutamate N-acetyltransferase/amino-acid acetyltransferase ArgJ [Halioxenophilus sp. WMMB6]|uniref:bifunctional glutamate N-acetyltransferase/amino-acid acetyltransferase ArgJ n=1 Tax=Halioxenophilus sp. WMMB6 TaxID=3073815 RepID=UPI00295ECDDA|nr:bifunctional glutamate N-acetyltransferase/amino-acid acetyltransferase ArgJ [Halioxenophilus sp. WMMB6]
MAVGEFPLPTLHPVKGSLLGATFADIKGRNPATVTRDDVVVMSFCEGSTAAGVFTKNAFCAAPVTVCKSHLGNSIRALVINAGNANACTGDQGLADAQATCTAMAKLAGCEEGQIMPFSTGVIGEPLPLSRLVSSLPAAWSTLDESNWERAARGIMTTDTRPKGASRQFDYLGCTITITGISKGAGMIRPNMATMLAYVVTDAAIAQPVLQKILAQAADKSFNRITIDGDTSTNDSCILVATGASDAPMVDDASGELYNLLADHIQQVLTALAQAIVADGEGATKLVTVQVEGGQTEKECLRVAYSVAHSPLVKTALFACDPNWGRIVAAIGYAGVKGLDPNKVNVFLDDVQIVANGCRAPSYSEEAGQQVMDRSEITIGINLGRGSAAETVWTTDFSHDYVTINAEYRT